MSSRMQAPQMERAGDREILDYLGELPDETDWRHPRREFEGGSIEASRELAKLTEKDPERGLRIAAELSPETHQRPVGMVIEAAAKSANSALALFDFIEKCELRGFGEPGYRVDVARALEAIAKREGGLPASMCRLLESWLVDTAGDERDADCKEMGRETRCILYSDGIGHILPEGNYPALRALFAGLLNRTDPDFDCWLTILENHARRRELPRVWQALAYHDLLQLGHADRARSTALLAALFERFPELLDVMHGLRVVDAHQSWLPEALSRGWLEVLRARGTRWHAQAFGELLVLRSFRLPNDTWALAEVDQLVAASNATDERISAGRQGVAFLSALALREEILLDRASDWLVRLADTEDPVISAALSDLFAYNDPPPYDDRMDALLAAIETHPYHLRKGRLDGILHALHQYLKHVPDRVVRLANMVIDAFDQELGDSRLSAARYASDLVDLSLTLQDTPGQLGAGLDLFERLQGLNLSEVEQVLNEREAQPGMQFTRRARLGRSRGSAR